jgi:hypothetical protein
MTDHPYLRVGCHRWYQSLIGIIHRIHQYFRKPAMRKYLDVHIRIIVVLTGDKLTEIYFLYLLYTIYFAVTTHLRPDKKVSILPPGDVNPGPIPLRRGLLEDSLYRTVRHACTSCDES